MKSPKTYKEAIEQSHREALYTVGAALLLFLFSGVFFFDTGFGLFMLGLAALVLALLYWRLSLIRIGCLVISKVFPA